MDQVISNVIAATTTFLLAVSILFSKIDLEKFWPEWLIISLIILLLGTCLMNIISGVRHFKNNN